MKSVSAPATLQTPHPLSRQMATREFDYDPISLKEPEDLHSWDWLGRPSRFISYLLHKSVQEVKGFTGATRIISFSAAVNLVVLYDTGGWPRSALRALILDPHRAWIFLLRGLPLRRCH